MENSSFSICVIIPVYNGERFLATAIANVKKQNYPNLEILVIDDGSTDGTAEVAAQFGDSIHYIFQENRGPAAARNCGIQKATGDAIAFLDVDDLWSEDKLHLQANYLKKNPEVEIVQGLIQNMKPDDEGNFEPTEIPYNYINIGSALYRKSVFDRVGFYDETLKFAEDTDWFIRAWENGVTKAVLDRVTLFYRKHPENMTAGKNLVELGFVRIYKKHLDRCRQRGSNLSSSGKEMPKINEYLGAPPNRPKLF